MDLVFDTSFEMLTLRKNCLLSSSYEKCCREDVHCTCRQYIGLGYVRMRRKLKNFDSCRFSTPLRKVPSTSHKYNLRPRRTMYVPQVQYTSYKTSKFIYELALPKVNTLHGNSNNRLKSSEDWIKICH